MNRSFNLAARFLVLLSVAALPFGSPAATLAKHGPSKTAATLTQSYIWYDGSRKQTVWLNPNLVAEFNPSQASANTVKKANQGATVRSLKRSQNSIRIWQVDNSGGAAVKNLSSGNPAGKYSPVFHAGPSSSGAMRALPGNVIVYLNPAWDEAAVGQWAASHKLEIVKKLDIGANVYVIKTNPGMEALDTANMLYQSGEVKAAFPDWWQEVSTR